jgi:putative RecB family exonuclease
VVSYEPDEEDLLATERKVRAIWSAISEAEESGDFQPNPGRVCDWCNHQALCPAYGGTPPPLPVAVSPEPAATLWHRIWTALRRGRQRR